MRLNLKIKLLSALFFLFLISGCGGDFEETVLTTPTFTPLSDSSQPVATGPQLPIEELAKNLHENLIKIGGVENASETVIMIATFVDSNDLETSNRLGRLVSEELITRMFTYGFQIVEFRATRTLLLKKREGDFALSREVEKLRDSYDAQYMILGTYTDAADSVFLNARIIDLETAHILSASNHEIIKSNEIVYLMEDGKKKRRHSEPLRPSNYER